ncbi:hypothetical protein F5887DRAFT_1013142 [Amanita rubescens]|nr:hypothetical protein F5887DRAFT_1013142 [Amanita rubescens]
MLVVGLACNSSSSLALTGSSEDSMGAGGFNGEKTRLQRRIAKVRHDMAQTPRIPTEVIREALSHSATIINDELLRLPMYSEARMSTIARQAAGRDGLFNREDRAIRRSWNAHRMPGEILLLQSHVGIGEPVFPPHSYWARGATAEMVYAANSEQIEEMIHLLGLTSRATGYVGGQERKILLELELGIRPGPR